MGAAVPVAMGVGLAIATQTAILGRASTHMPPLAVSLGLQISGLLVAAVWATTQHRWTLVGHVAGSWWWIPLGGVGWLVVAALGFAAARLGVAPALAISVAVQLIVGLAVDAVATSCPPRFSHLAGVVALCAGTVLIATPSS
jgi:uncharacterized membrane protein YdcZ (DUF606 family)